MTTPKILLIPGLWEGQAVFNIGIQSLTSLSYPAQTICLPSTSSHSPNNPCMRDDEAGIRSALQHLVEEEGEEGEKEVVMVMQSAGGFLGSVPTEELDRKNRERECKKGGVVRLVFLCEVMPPLYVFMLIYHLWIWRPEVNQDK